jgi:hypothetical protein
MNTDTVAKRSKLNRSLAVTGFILVIILLAWFAVQIVRYAPSGFNSLASLAQGLTQYRESLNGDIDSPLIVQSNVASSTAGTPIVLTWEKDGRLGRYAFSHACRDGLTVELVDTEGLRSLSCGTRYDLGDIETITIIADSTTEPVVELPYIISFTRTNDTEPVRAGESIVTVVNDDVVVATNDDNGTVLGETDSTDTEEVPATPTPKPTPVVTKPEYTYTLPVSDPNGYTDLKTTFIATGDIEGRTFKAGSIKQDTDGAIQFSIQNSGTKTSGKWTYTVLLPDSDTYTSPLQAPLLPTERAIISIGFPVDDSTSHTFVVVVAEASDSNLKNNSFKQVTRFLK